MDDRMIMQSGVGIAEKTMEVSDDIIQALLTFLSNKKTKKEEDEVLKTFSEYVKDEGNLMALEITPESFEAFEQKAREDGLTYYALTDDENKTVNIIFMEKDKDIIKDISFELAEKGYKFAKSPQITLTEMVNKYGNDDLVYFSTDNLDFLREADYRDTNNNANFAVMQRQDSSYMVIYRYQDERKLKNCKVIPPSTVSKLMNSKTNLKEIKNEIEKERRKEKEKERKKSNSRGKG